MTQGKPTNYETILAALVTKINAATGIAVPYIVPTLAEDYWEPGGHSDSYVLISNFTGQVVQGLQTGGGTQAILWNTLQDLILVRRLDTDTPGSDYNRLTNESYGLLDLWQKLLKAVEQWNPDDGDPDTPLGILAEPARTLSFSIRPRKYNKAKGWVQIRTKLQIVFVQQMT